jgi:hypothetical protein
MNIDTALTIKPNNPCDPDHMFEVFHSDGRDRFIGVDCACPRHVRSAVNLGNAIVGFYRLKASVGT